MNPFDSNASSLPAASNPNSQQSFAGSNPFVKLTQHPSTTGNATRTDQALFAQTGFSTFQQASEGRARFPPSDLANGTAIGQSMHKHASKLNVSTGPMFATPLPAGKHAYSSAIPGAKPREPQNLSQPPSPFMQRPQQYFTPAVPTNESGALPTMPVSQVRGNTFAQSVKASAVFGRPPNANGFSHMPVNRTSNGSLSEPPKQQQPELVQQKPPDNAQNKGEGMQQNPLQTSALPNSREFKMQLLNSQWPEKVLPIVNQKLCAQLAQLVANPNFSFDPSQFSSFLLRILPIYGVTLRRMPEICDKPIDLFYFYSLVSSQGGYRRITAEQKWPAIGLMLLRTVTNSNSVADVEQVLLMVRCIYAKILFPYEQIFLHRVPLNALHESVLPVVMPAPPQMQLAGVCSLAEPATKEQKRMPVPNASPSMSAEMSLHSEVEFLKDILETGPTTPFCNPFIPKRIIDFGRVNSRRLRLSLCNGTMTDFTYAINALIALSLSTQIALKSIAWVVDIGIELLREAFDSLASFQQDFYPFNGALGFAIFLRNIDLSQEDVEFLCQNHDFIHIILLTASWSRENILSLYCKSIVYSISFRLDLGTVEPFVADSFDDFLTTVQQEFDSHSLPLTSTIFNDVVEYTETKYDWVRSILVRDFRILTGYLGAFNDCHQSLVIIANTYQWIRPSRRTALQQSLWNRFLFPLFTGPLFKFTFSLVQLYSKLSKSKEPGYIQLYTLWHQGLIENDQFCIQDFRNIELALEFYLASIEFDKESFDSSTFSAHCIASLYAILIRLFSFPVLPSRPLIVKGSDMNDQINSKLIDVTLLLGRLIENECLDGNERLIEVLQQSQEAFLSAFTSPEHFSVAGGNEKLVRQLGNILSYFQV